MSFGLGRGRQLDPGEIGFAESDLPALPDDILDNPKSGHLDPREWFEEPSRPFEIEIGPGKGTFLLQQAEIDPETNFLGIEWAREFCAYTADRIRRRGVTNVRTLHGDATAFMRWRVPNSIVRVIHLYFSDPWPKKRHHKKRVLQDSFLMDAARVLVPGGELRIVTDHEDYWEWMESHFLRWTAPGEPFERLEFESTTGTDELVGTNFERKYRREGRPFHAAVLRCRKG